MAEVAREKLSSLDRMRNVDPLLVDFLLEVCRQKKVSISAAKNSSAAVFPQFDKIFWIHGRKKIWRSPLEKEIASTVVFHECAHILFSEAWGQQIQKDPYLLFLSEAFATATDAYFLFGAFLEGGADIQNLRNQFNIGRDSVVDPTFRQAVKIYKEDRSQFFSQACLGCFQYLCWLSHQLHCSLQGNLSEADFARGARRFEWAWMAHYWDLANNILFVETFGDFSKAKSKLEFAKRISSLNFQGQPVVEVFRKFQINLKSA